MPVKIAVVGSLNMDYTLQVERLPHEGETVKALRMAVSAGGKGANQAVAARRLGARVAMIGAVGDDDAGRELHKRLMMDGVDVTGVQTLGDRTGMAQITIDATGENTIIVLPGANAEVTAATIDQHANLLEDADYVLIQLEIPMEAVLHAARESNRLGRRVILNPAPAQDLPQEIYRYIDIFTPNETELKRLSGCSNTIEGARWLLKQGVKRVVVTLGARGCYYMDEIRSMEVPSIEVQAVDATGAGDAFNGALAVKLAEGCSFEDALRFANLVGATVAARFGSQDVMPRREEIKRGE